jgi:hypothetical protein
MIPRAGPFSERCAPLCGEGSAAAAMADVEGADVDEVPEDETPDTAAFALRVSDIAPTMRRCTSQHLGGQLCTEHSSTTYR